MPDENIDSLQIEITSSAESSVEHLNGLITSLRKLNRIGKADGLTIVKKQLQGIASIKFNNLSDQLKNVVSYVEQLEAVNKRISREITKTVKTPTVDTSATTSSISDVVDEIKETTERASAITEDFNVEPPTADWVDEVKGDCEKTLDTFSGFSEKIQARRDKLRSLLNDKKDNFGETPAFVTASSFETGLDDALQKLILQAELLEDKFTKLSQESGTPDKKKWYDLEKAIISVKQQYASLLRQTDKNAISVDALGKQAVKSTNGLGKLLDKFKNVLVYRVVRFLLSQIMKAASEGLRHISQFSEEANKVTSAYQTQFLYMKNSIGSALLPILQSVLPILIRISDGFADIANSIGMVSAALNGNGTFIKAKKYAQDYAQSLEQVKRSTTGFDELNILGQQNTNADTSQMFEEVEVTSMGVLESLGKVTALLGTLLGLLAVFKGKQIASFFTNMGKGLKSAYSSLKNMTTWKKGISSIAALAAEAVICYNAFRDVGKGTDDFGSALLKTIPIMAAVGVAMYAMWGPVGAVIGVVVGLTSAIAGFVSGSIEARKELNNAHFYEGANKMSVSLNALSDSFSNVWETTESMASATQNANDIINECAKEIEASTNLVNYYLSKLDETGSLTESEATEIRDNISSMVDNLETQMNTRMESIFATFNSLASLCKKNFVAELGEMEVEFLAFQKLLGNSISGYQITIDKLLDKAVQGTITEEERAELKDAVNALSSLNISYSNEQYQFDSLLEQALANGIDFKDKESYESFFADLQTKTTDYLGYLEKTYNESDRQIEEYKRQNQALYDQGKISKADYEMFNQSFANAKEQLKTLYDQAVQGVYDDVQKVIDAIQSSALSNMSTVYTKAKEDYANSSWWHKLWNTETDDVQKAMNDVKNGTIKDLNNAVNDFYSAIGSGMSAWLSKSAQDIINKLFDITIYDNYTFDSNGGMYYTPTVITTDNGNIQGLIDSEISENSSVISDTIKDYRNRVQGITDAMVDYNKANGLNENAYVSSQQWQAAYKSVMSTLNEETALASYQAIKKLYESITGKIAPYAKGGFPEDGLFFANHNELVGQFTNGKTAVANNMQIIAGIKQGVSEALQENGNQGGDWTIQIVDEDGRVRGETIITAAERKNRRDGKTVISVGG